jgi:acetylornithine aminotransferase
MHGTTFGGQPLATRIGHHVISRLSSPDFLSNMRSTASHFDELLSRLPKMFPELIPSPIRGRGLMRGIPFAHSQAPGELVKLARHRGVLLLTAGSDAVRLVPSLNVTKEECEHAVGVIESCLGLMQEEGEWGGTDA